MNAWRGVLGQTGGEGMIQGKERKNSNVNIYKFQHSTYSMKTGRLIFIFIFSLFLINIITAQPPFQQEEILTAGYEISIPQIGTIRQAEDFTFNFYVTNISDGVPIDNSSTSCVMKLKNSSGIQIYSTSLPYTNDPLLNNEWRTTVNGGNFSSIGDYFYTVHCFSSTNNLGGVQSVGFEVTPGGRSNFESIYIFIVVLMILLFIMLIWITLTYNSQRRKEIYKKVVEGYTMFKNNGDNNLGKVIMTALGYGILKNLYVFYYLFIVAFLFILTRITEIFGIASLIELFGMLYAVSLWGFVLVFIIMIFSMLELIFDLIRDIQDGMWGVTK